MERLESPATVKVVTTKLHQPIFLSLPHADVAYYTSPRPNSHRDNQDALGIRLFKSGTLLLAVADGLGGHANGDIAAKTAIEQLLKFRVQTTTQRTSEKILRKIEQAHDLICHIPGGGGTTLVAAEITEQYVRFFNVGDSVGLYCFDNGAVKYKTFEHSVTGLAVESGIMPTSEALDHSQSHVILNALGFPDTRIEISLPIERHPNEIILLASDGLTGNLTIEEIIEILGLATLEERMNELIQVASERMLATSGNPDDLTIVLFGSGSV